MAKSRGGSSGLVPVLPIPKDWDPIKTSKKNLTELPGSVYYSPYQARIPYNVPLPRAGTGVGSLAQSGGGSGGFLGEKTQGRGPSPARLAALAAATPAPPAWSESYKIAGAPRWWKGLAPSTLTANTSYLGLINNIIPFLSPEDQQSMAGSLFRADPTAFAAYNPETLTIRPGTVTTATQEQFTSAERAQNILKALSSFAKATGKSEGDLGPGYKFLRSVADVMRDYGGSDLSGQTRTQFTQMQAALDPLFAEAKSERLGAYEPIIRALASPFFSDRSLTPVSRTESGEYVFGQVNRRWFG